MEAGVSLRIEDRQQDKPTSAYERSGDREAGEDALAPAHGGYKPAESLVWSQLRRRGAERERLNR